jgi:hypothetical protein
MNSPPPPRCSGLILLKFVIVALRALGAISAAIECNLSSAVNVSSWMAWHTNARRRSCGSRRSTHGCLYQIIPSPLDTFRQNATCSSGR